MSISLKRKCITTIDLPHLRKKRILYYSKTIESLVLKEKEGKTIDDLPLEILTKILQYSAVSFLGVCHLKYVNRTWYDACKIVEFYLCKRSWWTIFKVSRYVDSYDKVMVACLGDCSHIKSKYYDLCWTGVGGDNSKYILESLQGTYYLVYNSHSKKKVPSFIKYEDVNNNLLRACTIECLYMSREALMNRIQELENAKRTTKLMNSEVDENGEYDFNKMSKPRIREVLGDYDYTQYNESEDDEY